MEGVGRERLPVPPRSSGCAIYSKSYRGNNSNVIELVPFLMHINTICYVDNYSLGNHPNCFHTCYRPFSHCLTINEQHFVASLSPSDTEPLLCRVPPPLLNVLALQQQYDCMEIFRQLLVARDPVHSRMTWSAATHFSSAHTPKVQEQIAHLQSHATEFSIDSGCHFFFNTFA